MPRRPKPYFRRLDQIVTAPTDWHLPGFVPRAHLTVIEGKPSEGKSMLTVDFMARATTGRPLPAGVVHPPCDVVLVHPEDPDAAVQQRIAAAGGDPSRIRHVDRRAANSPRPLDLRRDLPYLASLCAPEVGLVVIDSLQLVLGGAAATPTSILTALHGLAQIAQRTNTTVLAIRHLAKASGRSAIYAGSGSIGITGTARSVALVGTAPDDPNTRVLASVKNNLGPEAPALAFHIMDNDLGPAVEWLGTTDWCADDLLLRTTHTGGAPKLAAAEDVLRELLADGPRPQADIKAEATRRGIGWRTTQDAKQNLGVTSAPRKQPGVQGRGPYWWSLPKAASLGGTGDA